MPAKRSTLSTTSKMADKDKNACVICELENNWGQGGVQCNSCENWEHKKCCKLSEADYKILGKDAIPCYCTVCKRSMKEMPKQLKEREMELQDLKPGFARFF
jgi:hypothetical protein